MSVSQFSVLLLVLASLLLQSSVVRSDAGLIQSTCSKTPLPALCISALNSSPKSATADVPHLGLIIVNVLTAKAKAAVTAIEQLSATRPDLARPLSRCAHYYNVGIFKYDIPDIKQEFSSGNYQDAEVGAEDASYMAKKCENRFYPGQSPLTAANQDVQDVCSVLAAIAQQLL